VGAAKEVARPRVVLDTNVVVSALLFTHGSLAWLRDAWSAEALIPLVSRETVLEIVRVLAYPKFSLDEDERDAVLSDYLPFCEVVPMRRRPARVPECRDPDDRKFLELAIAGKADYLVTGDDDLLSVKMKGTVIVTPARFREGSEMKDER
jgi:uncharacterized protein